MKERKNVEYEYKKINTKELNVDYLYQRDVDLKRVNRIVRNYDPCLVNAIKVSLRDNKYYVFDGQHTISVEKLARAKGHDVLVDCKVFSGLTRLDEMELFVAQNGDSTNVRANEKMKALYNFGDKDVCGMVAASQLAGVRVDFTKGQAVNKVTAISTLMKIYLRMSRLEFTEMLSVIREAWDGSPDGFVREILIGMEKFYTTYSGQFKAKDLVSSLRKISPMSIVREGKSMKSGSSSNSTFARLILRAYNNGRRNRLEDLL